MHYHVSMPSAGYSHFYTSEVIEVISPKYGVNALGGLFSFLLEVIHKVDTM